MEPVTVQRSVRSYVLRSGRLTTAQRRALDTLWSRFGLQAEGVMAWEQIYGRVAPRMVEIGFGNGEALLTLAQRHPEWDFLGVEVHPPGVGRLLAGLAERDLGNVRVLRADAVEVLERCIPEASLDGVFIWFPDPWPKKRHQKRRLIQPPFVDSVVRRLRAGGRLHLATDQEEYAQQMLRVLEAEERLVNRGGVGCFSPDQGERPVTRFQERGERLGHRAWDLVFQRRHGTEEQ